MFLSSLGVAILMAKEVKKAKEAQQKAVIDECKNRCSLSELSDIYASEFEKMFNRKLNSCRNKVSFDELDNLTKGSMLDSTKSKIVYLKNFVVNIVRFTIGWLRDKIRNKLYKKKAKKVAVFAMENMLTSCNNQATLSELNSLAKYGYTHIMTELDNSGKIQDIEYVKDTNSQTDQNVRSFINKTGQGIVIVSG